MIVSYAQNFEDIILNRIFSVIEGGFYIDVGAQHPNLLSCTKLFYDKGWSGINVEPVEAYFNLLMEHRPRDTNLQLLLGDKPGTSPFYEVMNSGLSTQILSHARRHEEVGHIVKDSTRKVDTLRNICDNYAPKQIHFLKIDVEGAEQNVIEGGDFSKHRPWVILIEATVPLTQIEAFESWEPLLVINSYRHVYSDGLNRWYLAEEKMNLAKFFKYPPNVFDSFELEVTSNLRRDLEMAIQESNKLALELKNLLESRTWRYAKNLRKLVTFFRN